MGVMTPIHKDFIKVARDLYDHMESEARHSATLPVGRQRKQAYHNLIIISQIFRQELCDSPTLMRLEPLLAALAGEEVDLD